ncbi:DDE superfamily endonuclease [Hirsutella rhossiliensis]|uniref:DDE superfamily endonuclease domain-containing protein n=1 Tax=Hirsutella rhossiliensis TaxID=111463 RepID=A0A9P8SIS9_9HYPO|nr:DDE superfamily endonuclease domain-containing protein [Hirsutella rhossiliensis]KAH0962945.1 DDE superfamily endonuclease domain-containing protein [Hirsutella rhossiliensis]
MTEIRDQSIPREERVLLAVKAYQQGQFDSAHKAATAYDVPQSTVSARLRETALVQWVLSMDERGMPPTVVYTRRMANLLLSERCQETVGENWMMQEWYDRVAMAKQKWGILDEDVYNFDETGFQMGVIASARPGNREWVTVIESINCQGWALPAMVIFQGKVHQASWYEADVPKDWQIAPLDVGCFSPLKTIYGRNVQEKMLAGVNHIDKEDFLLLYIEARRQALSPSNIRSGFMATGLSPFNPTRVLSRLLVQVDRNGNDNANDDGDKHTQAPESLKPTRPLAMLASLPLTWKDFFSAGHKMRARRSHKP